MYCYNCGTQLPDDAGFLFQMWEATEKKVQKSRSPNGRYVKSKVGLSEPCGPHGSSMLKQWVPKAAM